MFSSIKRLFVIFVFCLSFSLNAAQITTQDVVYHEQSTGYLAYPSDTKPAPAIILIHEWWGLNDNIKQFAREFAELGYVALAVDLYDGKATGEAKTARKLATAVRNNLPAAFANLESAISFLKKDKRVDAQRLASIGWCFGGGWSYQMAKNNLGVKASIIYYGRFNPEDDLAQMRATILGHFGEKDRGIKVDTVKEFQVVLKTQNGDNRVYIYKNAGHGFANEDNANYDADAASLAWQRTVSFLKKYL